MRTIPIVGASLALLACDSSGTSTAEIKEAAEQRTRQQLNLSSDTQLQSTVWVGHEEYEGATVLCGTVSGEDDSAVRPQRFAATADPIKWLAFEDAHDPMLGTRTEKFPDWARYCGEGPAV